MLEENSALGGGAIPQIHKSNNSTLKYIAVRLKRLGDIEKAFAPSALHLNVRKLVVSRVDRRDPALRNFSDGLAAKGLRTLVDGCPLYWLQIDDKNSLEYYQQKNEVECVFFCDWFDDFKKGIRYFQGMQYVDRCMALAGTFKIKDQDRKIQYHI